MLTAVREGRLSLERIVELLYDGPRRVYGLARQPETCIEVALDEPHVLGQDPLHTKCGWTPFAGMTAHGRLRTVTLRGRTMYANGQILDTPAC
jgi:dihydroorotase